jgi:hypothetical protein
LTKALSGDSAELEKLTAKRQHQILLIDGGQKQLKLSKAHNQTKQVEENVLRLRVAQAEKALAREGDKVYSLEKQKLELDTVSSSTFQYNIINDTCCSVSNSEYLLFADDLKIYRSIDNVCDYKYLHSDIDSFQSWCSENGSIFNVGKTTIISFAHELLVLT